MGALRMIVVAGLLVGPASVPQYAVSRSDSHLFAASDLRRAGQSRNLHRVAVSVRTVHHSISAVYDASQQVTINGVVRQFGFVNPHPFVVVDVSSGGAVESWHLEMDNRGELARIGVTATTLRPGDEVTVSGSRSRTERRSLYVRKLIRPSDGFEYEQVGSSPRIKTR
jgi:hypothetical protein